MNTIDKIDKFLVKRLGINENTLKKEKQINAKELIVSKRIDLVAKFKYIESYEKKYDTTFFKNLYKETISCFSDGTFCEPGNKNKKSFDSYLKSFNMMIDDIKKNGFDNSKSIIPVSNNNIIFDGAHRTSVCAYFNKKINTVELPLEERNFSLAYFNKKCLDIKYLDYLCLEYSKMKNNIYVICIWPRCPIKYQDYIRKTILNSFNVIYEKSVSFTYKGLRNLMIQIYNNDNWIGNLDNNYKGIDFKVNNCYDKNSVYFYVIEENDLKKIQKIKNDIRQKVGIGNHSIHTTDSFSESIKVLNNILNDNTINFINNADIYKYKNTIKEIKVLKEKLDKNKISKEKIVFDGSVVLALYGLRENRDIDAIISLDEIKKAFFIDSHNDEISMYNKTIDDIIYNPDNYFYFDDMKFINLELLKIKKEKRGEIKDKRDLDLINSVLVKKHFFRILLLKIRINVIKLKLRIKHYILKFLIITKLDKPFKKVWKKLKRK